jgi:hypothetical protein
LYPPGDSLQRKVLRFPRRRQQTGYGFARSVQKTLNGIPLHPTKRDFMNDTSFVLSEDGGD